MENHLERAERVRAVAIKISGADKPPRDRRLAAIRCLERVVAVLEGPPPLRR